MATMFSPQAEISDPYRLSLDPELQQKVDAELCRIVSDVVSACRDRDDLLRRWRRQLEGWSNPTTNNPWPGACTVEASISREIHLTLSAAISAAATQHPYVCLEAVKPEDMDAATQDETYLNLKAQQYGFDPALRDVVYLALEGQFAPMHLRYEQKMKRWFELDEDGKVVLREEVQDGCLKFRTLDPWDFYAYPLTATGPQLHKHGATLVIERMTLSEEALLEGVRREGYDRKKVAEMLRQGPAGDIVSEAEEDTNDEYDRSGLALNSSRGAGGLWYCYQVIGRMPRCPDEDGEPQIPENLEYVDCVWMICPAQNIVFKQAYADSPDGIRPYVNFHAIKKPNRWLGEGPVSIISSMHEEMTCAIRFFINNMNLEAAPVMQGDERWKMKYPNWTIAPARVIPRLPGDAVGLKPLQWDINSQQLIPQALDRLDSWCKRMAASEGMNSAMAGRVRKAAEVHFAESMQQTKFDHYLSNIQEGIVEAFEIIRALLLQHMDEQGTDTAYAMGQSIEVSREALSREVRFFPQAASDSLTQAARLSRMQGVAQIVIGYWNGFQAWQQQGALGYMWQLHHRLLTLAGERSPERYIGPDPQQSMMQGGMDPQVAQAISALLGGMGGGEQGGAIPGASPAPPNGMNGMGAMNGIQPPNFGANQMMGAGMQQASSFGGEY